MNLEELFFQNRLFETYGFALSDLQANILQDYLVLGLSAHEIAANRTISKQAVSKNIKIALVKLANMEKNLRFLAWQDKMKTEFATLQNLLMQNKVNAVIKQIQKNLKEL